MSILNIIKGEKKQTRSQVTADTHQVVDTPEPAESEAEDAPTTTTTAATTAAAATEETVAEEEITTEMTAAPEEITTEEAMGSNITVAPTTEETQYTTTSMVMTSSSAPDSTKKRRQMSKIEAANEFVYGRPEEPWTVPPGRPSIDSPGEVRETRATTMRRSCVMKRVRDEEEERSRMEEKDAAWVDNEIIDPIVARGIPKSVYGGPKIPVRDTTSSKFRYLYNRKPPGVKVYFKPANDEQRKKPPFVVAAVRH